MNGLSPEQIASIQDAYRQHVGQQASGAGLPQGVNTPPPPQAPPPPSGIPPQAGASGPMPGPGGGAMGNASGGQVQAMKKQVPESTMIAKALAERMKTLPPPIE